MQSSGRIRSRFRPLLFGALACGLLGAVFTLGLVYAIAAFGGARSMGTLLLAGVALNALLGAVVSALVANVPDEQAVRGIVFWLQGDLEARTGRTC
ncbi:iron chelate uptake ABC transporter family permease subunit [Actinomadura sp. 21ATH]|uniref:iron chelate uptake ABC transporter family permease subunit n=1 Tax=Actinomadura sp. 21ATH TaxID=1735444 RepID=UPI0035BF1AE6